MTCRDVREVADSFLSEALLTETNHEILRHLDTCPSCRIEIDTRRRLRRSLQTAFDCASDLQPRADFAARLHEHVREAAVGDGRRRHPGRWFAIAAAVVLAAGLTGIVAVNRSAVSIDALATEARGDHWYCALKNRQIRMPMPLEEAAQRFDRAYRLLLDDPADTVATQAGPVRVVDRHSCAYGTRRFGHVVLDYHGRVVSLLLTATANDASATGAAASVDSTPYLRGRPVNGLSVVSVRSTRHVVLLVGDLEPRELSRLSETVSAPLVQQLEGAMTVPARGTLAAFDAREAIAHLLRSGS